MHLPVVVFPTYIDEMGEEFSPLFDQERQMLQFKRLLTGFTVANNHTIAHMNGLFTDHTDQSNLNRFITNAEWSSDELNRIKIGMINDVEGGGCVVLDDYVTRKYGSEMYGVDFHYDHTEGRYVKGQQVADCVFSGTGIYPLLSDTYIREESKWLTEDFRSKIDIQMEHLTRLVNIELNFKTVLMDTWYFCKKLTDHIEGLGKDWVTQSKSNRVIWSHDEWVPLKEFGKKVITNPDFKVFKVDDKKYQVKAFTVKMKNMGKVRLLVSFNSNGTFNFYVTNRLDWNEFTIISKYSRRWDIEVWHREGKGYFGLKDCQLRSREAVSRYLTLSALAATLLELATMLSPVYAALKTRTYTPELKHRWILAEIVGQLISHVSTVGDIGTRQIIGSILCPYRSTIKNRQAS